MDSQIVPPQIDAPVLPQISTSSIADSQLMDRKLRFAAGEIYGLLKEKLQHITGQQDLEQFRTNVKLIKEQLNDGKRKLIMQIRKQLYSHYPQNMYKRKIANLENQILIFQVQDNFQEKATQKRKNDVLIEVKSELNLNLESIVRKINEKLGQKVQDTTFASTSPEKSSAEVPKDQAEQTDAIKADEQRLNEIKQSYLKKNFEIRSIHAQIDEKCLLMKCFMKQIEQIKFKAQSLIEESTTLRQDIELTKREYIHEEQP